MSDNSSQKDTKPLPKSDEGNDETHKTQTFKQSKTDNDDSSTTLTTVIMSRDNPLLQRALNLQAAMQSNGTTTVGDSREVVLLIRGMPERLVMEENKTYMLGRFDTGKYTATDIDLTPYGAIDRGVSRQHAILHLEDNSLYITDLDSTNGTFVGGQRLEPHEPTIIHKGDEVLLGRLAIQIMFR